MLHFLRRSLSRLLCLARLHKRYSVLAVTLLISVGVLLFSWHPAFAQSKDISQLVSDSFWLDLLSRIMLYAATLCLKITVFILTFVIEIAGYNGYLDSTAVTVGWVMVRDMTNMIFVIALLLMSFGTILGIEQYEWKKMIVKLVMAAIFVNFSRVICALFIDAAQVVMTTFINGVAATAGGNLINAFNIDKIRGLSSAASPSDIKSSGIFAASVSALFFSATIMATLGVFMVILVVRMITLWVLVVLSPLAFVLNVLPQTESYAKQWWSEMGTNVTNGPVLLFFLWLSFVTIGNGKINNEISNNSNVPNQSKITDDSGSGAVQIGDAGGQYAGINDAMGWNSMANFAIGVAMLLVSVKVTQQVGGMGAGMLEKATDFGKKAALNLSGINAARWAGGQAIDKSKAAGLAALGGVGAGLYALSLSNAVERAKNFGARQVEGYRSWRAQGPRVQKQAVWETEKDAEGKDKVDANGQKIYKTDETGQRIQARNNDGSLQYENVLDENGQLKFEEKDSRGFFQRFVHGRHEKLVKSKKILEKVQNQKKVREELMDKRVTAVPRYLMQFREGMNVDAEDRMEQGQLEAEKMRSQAKTQEHQALGKTLILNNPRYKDGGFQTEKGSLAKQIGQHQLNAERNEAVMQDVLKTAKADIASGKPAQKTFQAKVKADLNVKMADAKIHQAEALATTNVVQKMREKEKEDRKEIDKIFADNIAAGANAINAKQVQDQQAAEKRYNDIVALNNQQLDAKYKARVDAGELSQDEADEQKQAEKDESLISLTQSYNAASEAIAKEAADAMKKMKDHEHHEADERREAVRDVVSRTIAAEKVAHTEGAKVETIKKEKEEEYFKEHHGQEELKVEAELKARNAAAEAAVKRLTGKAERDFIHGDEFEAVMEDDGHGGKRKKLDAAGNVVYKLDAKGNKIKTLGKALVDKKAEEELGLQAEEGEKKLMEDERKKLVMQQMQEGKIPNVFSRIQAAGVQKRATEAEIKEIEEESKRKETESAEGIKALNRLKKSEINASTAGEVVKKLETEARLKLVRGEDGDQSYQKFLKAQSYSKIAQDGLGSIEKAETTKVMNERINEAREIEDKAVKLMQEASEIHAEDSKPILQQIAEEQANLDNLKLEKSQIERAIAAAVKEGSTEKKAEAENALAQFNADEKKGGSMDSLRKSIALKRAEVKKNDDEKMDDVSKARRDGKIKEAERIRQNSSAWQYAAAKAEEDEAQLEYNVGHDSLMSNVKQAVVFNARGIQVPTGALTQPIERFAKEYSGMDYDMYVNNLGNSLKANIDKQKRRSALEQELKNIKSNTALNDVDKQREIKRVEDEMNKKENKMSDADKAAMAGLMVHGQKNSWLDDAIWKYMEPGLRQEVVDQLGWKDMEFDNKKINDIMAIFASGGNLQFAGMHTMIGDMMDHAKKNMGIGLTDFFEKLQNGFSATEKAEFVKTFGEDFKTRIKGPDGKGYDINDLFKKETVEKYMGHVQSNQAQLQLIANMRDEAAGSTHPENGGHGQFIQLSNGQKMYVLTGQKIANDNVMGEVRKLPVSTRVKMQTHATTNLDEGSGFATSVDEQKNTYVRGDVNSGNDHRGTNVRYLNQTSGLSADEEKADYTTDSGFQVTGTMANGQASARQKWLREFKRDEFNAAVEKFDTVDKDGKKVALSGNEAAEQFSTNDVVNNLFAPRMFSNPADFLISMGKMSGVNDTQAANGTMHIVVNAGGKKVPIDHYDKLRELYNRGVFSSDGKPPKRLLPAYKKKAEDGGGGGAPTPTPGTPPPSGGSPKTGKKGKKKGKAATAVSAVDPSIEQEIIDQEVDGGDSQAA